MKNPMIDRPVFIVGMPRSGTTILRDVMAAIPAFATTTNVTRKAPLCYPALRALSAVYRTPRPVEAGSMWDRFVHGDSDVLTAADASPAARSYFTRAVSNVLRLYNKSRFLAKCPRNGLRIEFLRAIFPDARFIHLLRDSRAVTQSVMEKRRKSGRITDWWDVKPDTWRQRHTLPPIAAVAHQWNDVVTAVAEAGARLTPSDYIEVRYEDFSADPIAFIRRLLTFCEVEWTDDDIRRETRPVKNFNDKWARAFSAEDVATIDAITGETMRRHGYN